jgi:hypothetical protein
LDTVPEDVDEAALPPEKADAITVAVVAETAIRKLSDAPVTPTLIRTSFVELKLAGLYHAANVHGAAVKTAAAFSRY